MHPCHDYCLRRCIGGKDDKECGVNHQPIHNIAISLRPLGINTYKMQNSIDVSTTIFLAMHIDEDAGRLQAALAIVVTPRPNPIEPILVSDDSDSNNDTDDDTIEPMSQPLPPRVSRAGRQIQSYYIVSLILLIWVGFGSWGNVFLYC